VYRPGQQSQHISRSGDPRTDELILTHLELLVEAQKAEDFAAQPVIVA
jgi:hypothetical protein